MRCAFGVLVVVQREVTQLLACLLLTQKSRAMVNINRWSQGPIRFVNCMTPAHQIYSGGMAALSLQSFYLVSLMKRLKLKNDRAAVTFRSSPAPETQPFCAPRDYDSYANRWCQKAELNPPGGCLGVQFRLSLQV